MTNENKTNDVSEHISALSAIERVLNILTESSFKGVIAQKVVHALDLLNILSESFKSEVARLTALNEKAEADLKIASEVATQVQKAATSITETLNEKK